MEKTAQGKGFRFPFPWEPHPNDLRGHSWLCPLKDPPATGCGRHPGSGYDGGADGAGLRRLDGRRDAVVLCALTSPGHGTPVSVGAGMRNGGLIPSVACGDSSPLTQRGAFFCCKSVTGTRCARIRGRPKAKPKVLLVAFLSRKASVQLPSAEAIPGWAVTIITQTRCFCGLHNFIRTHVTGTRHARIGGCPKAKPKVLLVTFLSRKVTCGGFPPGRTRPPAAKTPAHYPTAHTRGAAPCRSAPPPAARGYAARQALRPSPSAAA